MIKKKKNKCIYILNHFTLPVCLTPGQLLSVQTKLGSVFCMDFVHIFVNSLLQRKSNLIMLNDFAFCFFRFR